MPHTSTEKLDNVFRVVFNLPANHDVTTVSKQTQKNWDSLAHVTLVSAVENEFDVTIDTIESLRLTSYDAVRQLLDDRGV
jgi:acyl carrier protein